MNKNSFKFNGLVNKKVILISSIVMVMILCYLVYCFPVKTVGVTASDDDGVLTLTTRIGRSNLS